MLSKTVVAAAIAAGAMFALQLKFGPSPDAYRVDKAAIAQKHFEQAERDAESYAEKLQAAKGILPPGWTFGDGWSKPEVYKAPGFDI